MTDQSNTCVKCGKDNADTTPTTLAPIRVKFPSVIETAVHPGDAAYPFAVEIQRLIGLVRAEQVWAGKQYARHQQFVHAISDALAVATEKEQS